MRIKRAKSKCKNCSLREKTRVWGISRAAGPKIVIVGEAPGMEEDRDGYPFVGKAGKFFIRACSIAGINWETTYKTNVISCRPPGNKIDSYEADNAKECCKGGFIDEIMELSKTAKVFIAAGATAMHAFGIDGGITKNRGSVYLCKIIQGTKEIQQVSKKGPSTIVVIPTFHPSYIMRGQWKEEVTWINDLEKALTIAKTDYEPPKELFNINPSIEDLRLFVKKVVKDKITIGVDIETSGLDPEKSRLVVVGLASSGEEAISVPFLKQGFKPYWSDKEEIEASTLLNAVLSTCPLLFQNALFDVAHLRSHGYTVTTIQDDILLIHHATHPELPHNLGYIVSIYGKTPYWKDIVLKSEDAIRNQDDKEFRTYNLRDSVVLHQVLPSMLEHIREVGTEDVYRNISLKLIDPILGMQFNGIGIDQKKLAKFNRGLKKRIAELEEEIYNIEGIDRNINFNSGDDMRYLLFADKPKKYYTALGDLQLYTAPGSKRKKDTKTYKKIVGTIEAIDNTIPFIRTKATKQKSEAGNAKTDEEARFNIMVSANNRLQEIRELKDPRAKEVEMHELERLLGFLKLLNEHRDKTKMLSTYGEYDIGNDGRVHFKYMIHGTATGRLSSRS